jgi:hypothetical protein
MKTNDVPKSGTLTSIAQIIEGVALTATALQVIATSTPVRALVWRRALSTIGPRLAWTMLPLAGAGLGYVGVRAWQRRAIHHD